MSEARATKIVLAFAFLGALAIGGCKTSYPHTCVWPATGDVVRTHAKPPEGGYYTNWDPYAAMLEVEPVTDVNPVGTQHVLVATVKDADGQPLPNRRVEWLISRDGVGDIVEVDESGWRASRGHKLTNQYAVSHTNNFDHVLTRGNDDPDDDVSLTKGQTWCVITSPVEGTTHVIAYAPGIHDWGKHKVIAVKQWYDVAWEWPPEATNPVGTTHRLVTKVMKYSDSTPLAGYVVNYEVLDGPAAVFADSGTTTASVETDGQGLGTVTLRQAAPAEGTNSIQIDIIRPEDTQCCRPAVHIATGVTKKTWIGPKIAISKTAPARAMVGESFDYNMVVTNPSQVAARNVVVRDVLPDGISYVSSSPPAQVRGQALAWSLGTLAGQGKSMVRVAVKGTRSGAFDNCAEVAADQGLSARDCARTVIVAPKLVIEKRCPSEVIICDPIEYTVVVRNTGDGPATNVQITDRLPDGLETEDGRTSVPISAAVLEAGQAKQASFKVKAKRTGTFVNKVTATADGGLTAEASCTTVVRQPVLSVTKSGPDIRYVGRPLTYQITVSNTGDAPARETSLVDAVPGNTEFVEASHGGRLAEGKVTWDLGTIAVGAAKTVTLKLKAAGRGVARNMATAVAICAEASGSATTKIEGIPAVLLETIDVEDPIEVGANETYVITVTNQGSSEGTNVVVVCTLPPEEEYVSADGPTRASVDGKKVSFAPLPSLDPKAKAVYRVVVRGTRAGDVRFKVTMTSDQAVIAVEETESTHIY